MAAVGPGGGAQGAVLREKLAAYKQRRVLINQWVDAALALGTGGQITTLLTSFTATCPRLHINPFVYLREGFDRINAHPAHCLAELLPERWKAAHANDIS